MIMGACTVNIPAIVLSGGPMLDGHFAGGLAGSGTIVWHARQELAAGRIDLKQFVEMVASSAPRREPFEVTDTAPIVTAVLESAADVLGQPAQLAGVSYWADSAFIAAAGIPTVLFGPAGDGAHAAIEWVSVDATIACAETLTHLAVRLCQ
jgi:acetylornithine deacetylase/succinyl-diaminopimelate desuccinylase-like protein